MIFTSGIRNSSSLHPLFGRCFSYPVTEFRLQALDKNHAVERASAERLIGQRIMSVAHPKN